MWVWNQLKFAISCSFYSHEPMSHKFTFKWQIVWKLKVHPVVWLKIMRIIDVAWSSSICEQTSQVYVYKSSTGGSSTNKTCTYTVFQYLMRKREDLHKFITTVWSANDGLSRNLWKLLRRYFFFLKIYINFSSKPLTGFRIFHRWRTTRYVWNSSAYASFFLKFQSPRYAKTL